VKRLTLSVFAKLRIDGSLDPGATRRSSICSFTPQTIWSTSDLSPVGLTTSESRRPLDLVELAWSPYRYLGPPANDANALTGAVEDATFLGAIVRLRVRLDEGTLLVDAFNLNGASLPERGEAVTVKLQPGGSYRARPSVRSQFAFADNPFGMARKVIPPCEDDPADGSSAQIAVIARRPTERVEPTQTRPSSIDSGAPFGSIAPNV
jgi:hypothetical protein